MNIESINNMKVSIGHGQNDFTMTRGSFNYKEKTKWKKTLQLALSTSVKEDATDMPELSVLIYKDATSEKEYEFKIEKEDCGRIHVWMNQRLNPEDVNRFWLTIPVDPEEHFYGCGETFSEFDLKGQKVRIWTAEHQNANRIGKKIIRDRLTGKHPNHKLKFDKYESYYVQPTFVSSGKYFLHVNGTGFMTFDFTHSNRGYITLAMTENPDFYIDFADDFTGLSRKLTSLLGRQNNLPDWVYDGVILASQEGTASIEKKIQLAKDNDIPLVGLWCQDWCGCRRTGFGYQVMWNWEWDSSLYPDLDDKIKTWRAEGIRILGYINPFIALEKNLYEYASSRGFCVKDKDGADYLVTITTFPAAMIDFTNPDAWEWYKEIIRINLIEFGLSGWMADFGEYLPTDCILFDGSDPEKRHNEWPALWAKLNHEAVEESGRKDIFFFTRAGFTDTIKYSPVMWNGDQHVDFSIDDGIGSVIPASLSLAMSGFGITHSDVGGYTTIMNMTRSRELLMRWEEMNAFSPIYRFHEGNQPSRNVQFGDDSELLRHLSICGHIHVLLKDYLKAVVKECAESGTPVMRPIFYHYDEKWAYTEASEYLLGRDILVAPVLHENSKRKTLAKRKVRLPADTWIHMFTGKVYDVSGIGNENRDEGAEFIIDAPFGQPPVFIRSGSEFSLVL